MSSTAPVSSPTEPTFTSSQKTSTSPLTISSSSQTAATSSQTTSRTTSFKTTHTTIITTGHESTEIPSSNGSSVQYIRADDSGGLPVVAVVVPIIVLLLLGAAVVVYCWRKRYVWNGIMSIELVIQLILWKLSCPKILRNAACYCQILHICSVFILHLYFIYYNIDTKMMLIIHLDSLHSYTCTRNKNSTFHNSVFAIFYSCLFDYPNMYQHFPGCQKTQTQRQVLMKT